MVLFLLCRISLYATDSEVIDYVSYLEVNGDKLIMTDSVVIQINNPKGEYATWVSVLYSKNEKVTMGEARIEDLRGNVIRVLKKNEIKDQSAVSNATMYQDRFVKYAQLMHNRYPYRIVYSYQKSSSDFMTIAAWQPIRFNNQDVKSARLVVDIPQTGYSIRYKCENIGEPVVRETTTRKLYCWKTEYHSQNKETLAPDPELKMPVVQVIPLRFKYGVEGSWDSWVSFGDWMCKLNNKSTLLPESEQIKIDGLLSGITDPEEKARILYRYLQEQTRYINVNLKTGGFKTYPASYVVENKYGDCKALSNYMLAMLRYAGVDAYYTLINAGSDIEPLDKGFPSSVFNHVIVTLPLKKDTVFLECTDKDNPFGYVSTFIQGRNAFMINPGGSAFVQLPALSPEDVTCTSSQQIHISNNVATIDLAMLLKGPLYEDLTYYFTNLPKKEMEEMARKFIPLNSFSLNTLNIEKTSSDMPEITLKAQVQTQNCYKKYGKSIVLTPFSQPLATIEPPAERTQGVQIDCPVSQKDTLVYEFSDVELSDKKPEDISITSPYGQYTVRFNFNGNQFQVFKNLLIFRGFYPVEDYAEFYRFWSSVKSADSKNYYLESK